ncbi:hypothetical protein KAR91_40575 [Candidatus Pacearchaeota archaeon]|nr:hypothetical protein [Candidatus Pacearchaeota archaeon]
MSFIRRLRVIIASLTLWCFVGLFVPYQATAILPAGVVVVGVAALASSALIAAGGVNHYSESAYGAGQQIISATGEIARKVFTSHQAVNSVIGGQIYGKWNSLKGNFNDVVGWIQDNAAQVPNLFGLVDDAYTPGASPIVAPSVGDIFEDSSNDHREITAMGAEVVNAYEYPITGHDSCCAAYASIGYIDGGSCIAVSYSLGTPVAIRHSPHMKENDKCGLNFTPIHSTTIVDDPVTYPPPAGPGTLDTGQIAENYPYTEVVQDELDDVIVNNPVAFPPVVTPPSSAEKAQIAAHIAAEVASQSLADLETQLSADPTNVALQVAVEQAKRDLAGADVLAEQTAAETEPETIEEAPYVPVALPGVYTLPPVDFAVRWSTFLTTIKTNSPLFNLTGNLTDIPTGGTSVMSVDFGSLGGVQTYDLSNLAGSFALIKSIMMCVFAFVATRIIILKR